MIDFKLGQQSFFFLQTEWVSHPKLNGFTQHRGGRGKEGGKSRSVVDMDEWGYSRTAHTVVTQIGPNARYIAFYDKKKTISA